MDEKNTNGGLGASGAARPGAGQDLPVTRDKADALFWLGRYSERVYTTLLRYRHAYDDGRGALGALANELDQPLEEAWDAQTAAEALVYSEQRPASVRSSMQAAFGNALVLRPDLGTQSSNYVELALAHLGKKPDPAHGLARLRCVSDDLLAFWGSVEDGMASSEAKALLFLGKYVERIDLWSRFGADEAKLDRPVRKLVFYLGYVRHPKCLPLAEALATLSADVSGRGYGESVTNRLNAALATISG